MNLWEGAAATFDDAPDHGLRDPAVRQAWAALLRPLLPSAPSTVADLGCGTGSLATLLAEAGHRVHALDSAAQMVIRARAKTAGWPVTLTLGDAAVPPFAPVSFDVVLARHVLWTLPSPSDVLGRWTRLLRPSGRLILIEGHWSTGAGLTAAECADLVLQHRRTATVHPLADPALWGGPITDERYLLVSES